IEVVSRQSEGRDVDRASIDDHAESVDARFSIRELQISEMRVRALLDCEIQKAFASQLERCETGTLPRLNEDGANCQQPALEHTYIRREQRCRYYFLHCPSRSRISQGDNG